MDREREDGREVRQTMERETEGGKCAVGLLGERESKGERGGE